MNNAESSEELDKLREEAKQHARAVREAVAIASALGGRAELGRIRGHRGTRARRSHGRRARAREPRRRGEERAQLGGRARPSPSAPRAIASRIGAASARGQVAHDKIAPEVKMGRARARAPARKRRRREPATISEKHRRARARWPIGRRCSAERREPAAQGRSRARRSSFLQGAEAAMREGARALGSAEGERALQRLKEAQRLLEMAQIGTTRATKERRATSPRGGQAGQRRQRGELHRVLASRSDPQGRRLQGARGVSPPGLRRARAAPPIRV